MLQEVRVLPEVQVLQEVWVLMKAVQVARGVARSVQEVVQVLRKAVQVARRVARSVQEVLQHKPGIDITDACADWTTTVFVLEDRAATVKERRKRHQKAVIVQGTSKGVLLAPFLDLLYFSPHQRKLDL